MTRPILNTTTRRPFDFELSEAQEARAATLHRESIVFDLLSQHAGGPIFAHYPRALQAEFQARLAAAPSPVEALVEARHWPFELAALEQSDLLREWFAAGGLTCGTYS